MQPGTGRGEKPPINSNRFDIIISHLPDGMGRGIYPLPAAPLGVGMGVGNLPKKNKGCFSRLCGK
jgi:hypothetical protein